MPLQLATAHADRRDRAQMSPAQCLIGGTIKPRVEYLMMPLTGVTSTDVSLQHNAFDWRHTQAEGAAPDHAECSSTSDQASLAASIATAADADADSDLLSNQP